MISRRRVGHEHGPRPLPVVACLTLVAACATPVVLGSVPAVDRGVRSWTEAHQDQRVFAVLDAVTRLTHWPWVCATLVAVAGAAAVRRRTILPLAQALLSVFLLVVVTGTLKAVVGRPGPTGVAPPAHDGAWPSGHAMALVVATVVVLRLVPTLGGVRGLRLAAAFLPAAFLSAALVYCGHHWFTDVAVAFPLGFVVGWSALSAERWGSRHRRSVRHD